MANNLPVPETKIEYYLNAIAGGATPSPGPEPTPSSGGVMRVRLNQTILDKTWQEISDCFANGGYAYVIGDRAPGLTLIMPIKGISHEDATYSVGIDTGAQTVQLTCLSPDDYPTFNGGGGGGDDDNPDDNNPD